MLKMVPLSCIKDNPYRDKKRNPVDKDRVDQLKESIGTTGFWKGVYGREANGWIEIAFGHTRVDAARAVGLKEIPIEIENLTDSDMLMRMTRENLRGELLVTLEAVSAAVKALSDGVIEIAAPDPKTRKDTLRYAPSFVPGKLSVTPGATHPYTADGLARFLGGAYIRPTGHAQPSVLAALGILEMEERKVTGFSERTLKVSTEDGSRYLGAKAIIQIVSDVKQREVKVIERREKTAEEARAFDAEQRRIQAARKAEEAKAEAERKVLVKQLADAKKEEDDKRAKEIKEKLAKAEEYAVEKALDIEVRQAELTAKVEQKKKEEAEARKEDAYVSIRREVERILHKLDGSTATSREALAAEVKALVRQPLNNQDRERLRQAALTMGAFYADWVAMQFLPPLSTKNHMNEYRKREEAKRRAEEKETHGKAR